MKAIGYVRVSSEQQVREGESLDVQRERIDDYCKYQKFDLAEIFEDAGISGSKNRTRPDFMRLLNRLEQGDVQVLVLVSLDRLSRDMLTLLCLERLLSENNVQIHTLDSGGSVDTSSPSGFMNFAMRAFMGEFERRNTKARTKAVMESKGKRGEVCGSIPYGFMRAGDNLVENPDEQRVVKRANLLYRRDANLLQICRKLESEGLQSRNGKPFDATQIKRMVNGYERVFTWKRDPITATIKHFIEVIG